MKGHNSPVKCCITIISDSSVTPRRYLIMTLCHDVFLIPRLLIFSYRQQSAPSEAGNTSAEVVLNLHMNCLSLCPYESEPRVRMGAQVGCHRHYRSGEGKQPQVLS